MDRHWAGRSNTFPFCLRDEIECTLDNQLALAVKRDYVIAVVEHHCLRGSAELLLQEVNVAQARAVVLARMHDQGGLHDLRNLLLYLLNKPSQLQHQATRQRGNASLGAVAALDRLLDDRTNARVLDAPGVPFGKWKHLGEPFLCDQLEEVVVPGDAPTVEPE